MDPTSQEKSSFGGLGANGGGGFDTNVSANVDAKMNYNVSTSTGTGDIIIEGDKKSKKGLIVGLALLVGVIVVGGMVAAIIFLGQKGESARDKFNKLINYVVSGEESTANYTGTYNNDTTYYFDEQQKDINNRPALYGKTSELLDDFMDAYNKLENKEKFSSDNVEFDWIMDNERRTLEIASIVRTKKIPDIYDAINALYDGENIVQKYKDYYDFSVLNMESFKKNFDDYISLLRDVTQIYYDNNCLSGNTVRSGCIDGSSDESLKTNYNEKTREINRLKKGLDGYRNGDYLVKQLFKAKGLLDAINIASLGGWI